MLERLVPSSFDFVLAPTAQKMRILLDWRNCRIEGEEI